MSVPNFKSIVEAVYATGVHTLSTKEGAGLFTEAAVEALHAHDGNFGHLRKPEGRTHVVGPDGQRHAVDVVLYRASGQIVDIIVNAGEEGARVGWSVGQESEYGPDDWYAPAVVAKPPDPPPTGEPPTGSLETILNAILARLDGIESKLEVPAPPPSAGGEFPDYHAEGVIDAGRFFGKMPFGVTLKPVR